jgi:hypothetical protein
MHGKKRGQEQRQDEGQTGPDEAQAGYRSLILRIEEPFCFCPRGKHQKQQAEVVEESENYGVIICRGGRVTAAEYTRGEMGQKVSENTGTEEYAGENFANDSGLAQLKEHISEEMGGGYYD